MISSKQHGTYARIISAVKSKRLAEPFFPKDVPKACRAKNNAETFRKFPSAHRKKNPYNHRELFVQLKDGRYKLIRPFRYGIK